MITFVNDFSHIFLGFFEELIDHVWLIITRYQLLLLWKRSKLGHTFVFFCLVSKTGREMIIVYHTMLLVLCLILVDRVRTFQKMIAYWILFCSPSSNNVRLNYWILFPFNLFLVLYKGDSQNFDDCR